MSEKLTLFDRFGGTRKMAEALGEAPSTVQSWKSAGRIPAFKQPDVLAKAQELGLNVEAEDIIFPLGRDVDSATYPSPASIEPPEVGHGPFSGDSPSTCSMIGGPSTTPADSPTCSPTAKAKAA